MSGLVFTPTPDNRQARAVGHELLPATLGEGVGAFFGDPTLSLAEEMARNAEIAGSRPAPSTLAVDPMEGPVPPPEPQPFFRKLSPAELEEEFGGVDLKFDRPMTREEARILFELRRSERIRQDVISRAPSGLGPGFLYFGAMLARSMMDPVNIGAAFVPVVSQARYAGMIARMGKTGARVSRGVIEGITGNALIEPGVLALSRQQQLDYTMADAIVNIALGGVLGGGLHAIGGKMGDYLSRRAPETREAALATAVAQTVQGKRPEVTPIFRSENVPAVTTRERLLSTTGRIDEDPFVAQVNLFTQRTTPAQPRARAKPLGGETEGVPPITHTTTKTIDGKATKFFADRAFLTGDERITAAAIRVGDEVYISATHADAAAMAARRRQETIDDLFNRKFDSDGFITGTGRYVGRQEAVRLAAEFDQIDRVGDLTPEESRRLVVGTDELFAEQLKPRPTRQQMYEEAIAFAEREALPERSSGADFEAAERAAAEEIRDIDIDSAKEDLQEIDGIINDLRAQGLVSEETERELARFKEQEAHAKAYGKAAKAAANCIVSG